MGYQDRNILSIRNLAEEDRPREKLLLKGRSALTDAELIAILLGSGNARQNAVELAQTILRGAENSLHRLARMSVADLQQYNGIGEAKAIAVVSALELGRRRKEAEPVKMPRITCATDVFDLMQPFLLDLDHEQFWLLSLNRANRVVAKEVISMGGQSGTVADPKVIFKKALDQRAAGIILVHNHPSGQVKPSDADIRLTNKLVKAGQSLELPVIDHIIFGDHAYFSFIDESLL